MAADEPGVEPQDCEAIDAYEAALDAFAEKLNLLHISGGSPSYSSVATASVRPRLTTTGLNEMLSGKRLPSLETLLEYLRVVTTPSGLDKQAAAKFRADTGLVEEWRGHWRDAKLLQRRAQAANKRVRATVRQVHDTAVRDAEALRTAAHAEAERIRTSAHTDAEDMRARARRDAEEILDRARETAIATTPESPEPRHPPIRAAVVRVGLPPSLGTVIGVGPAAAVLAVAVVAVAMTLVSDSFTGTTGDCPDGRTQAARHAAVSSNGHGAVRPVAFAAQPAAFITLAPTHPLLRGFPTPSTSATPDEQPTPNTSPTPAQSPTPSPSATSTPTPAPSRSARCTEVSG